jgi:hypothetical protein
MLGLHACTTSLANQRYFCLLICIAFVYWRYNILSCFFFLHPLTLRQELALLGSKGKIALNLIQNIFLLLRVEPRVSHMLSMCSITEANPSAYQLGFYIQRNVLE